MEFITQTTSLLHQLKTSCLGVGVYSEGILSPVAEALNLTTDGKIRSIIFEEEFLGSTATTLILRHLPGAPVQRIVLVGLGKKEEYCAAVHAKAEYAFIECCKSMRIVEGVSTLVSIPAPGTTACTRARNAAISAGKATYFYNSTLSNNHSHNEEKRLKKVAYLVDPSDIIETQQGLREGSAIAEGVTLTQTLANLPGNICTPTYLGNQARQLAKEFDSIQVEVFDVEKVQELGMGAFTSVARGSKEPPCFIVLKYMGKPPLVSAGKTTDAPTVLVGKGVTFDSGGISIKPSSNMDEMKFDMSGAASVLGTLRAVAKLKLKVNIVGLIPACENLPSGTANKPGDVVSSMSGKTIEVLNTDAEGRLILCDALTYATHFEPAAIIDIATLTGACVIALGHVNSGLFSTDDNLAKALIQAGQNSLDKVWRMPVERVYRKQIKSSFADMANVGSSAAGAITAACFLSEFVEKYPWAHLDIAGTAWKSGENKGATGRPVPMLVQYFLDKI